MFLSKKKAPDPVLVTVSGKCEGFDPAKGRPGCVLRVTDGHGIGRYYVPLSPHDCRRQFPEGAAVKFRVYADALPDGDGVYDTAGGTDRLWDITGRDWPKK